MAKAKWDIKVLFIDAFKDILREKDDVSTDNIISQKLSAIAKRYDLALLVSVHINKVEVGGSQRKIIRRDIRGSGRIGDDARQILILQAEEVGDKWNFTLDVEKVNAAPPFADHPMTFVANRCRWEEGPFTDTRSPYGD